MLDKEVKRKVIHVGLFIITFCTTTIAGAEWMTGKSLFYGDVTINWDELILGMQFSFSFLLILTCHEFGHYFMAQYHKVKVTLPYYIPLWFGFLPGAPSIGTMGAFISIKQVIESRKKYFDIGIAGPLAGFVIGFFVLAYGFSNLPEQEKIFEIHPDYKVFGLDYADHVYNYDYQVSRHKEAYLGFQSADSLSYLEENGSIEYWSYPEFQPFESYESMILGKTLLFSWMESWFVSDPNKMPNQHESMHNPFLLAGFLSLFFTALNLLPIGQLDGGHILYGLVGMKYHSIISRVLFTAFVFYAGLGVVNPFQLSEYMMWEGVYLIFLYYAFYRFSKSPQERMMYAVIIFAAQFGITYIFPFVEGYSGWLLFAFFLGRVAGVDHPPVLIDKPLDQNRMILGWISFAIFIISFSPQPLVMKEYYKSENKSDTPTFRSVVNPSPYFDLMDKPNSLARASSTSINSGEEINVLTDSPVGSKN
jgi:membrane-associated protease RseP (regulator of RpoE activity)